MTATRRPPRRYFDDEEPDVEDQPDPFPHWWEATAGTCQFCGLTGHKKDACPNRPLDS